MICTPEVIHLPLKISLEEGKEKVQRFILATDGLFDVLENKDVGEVAARKLRHDSNLQNGDSSNNPTARSPKEAAANVLEKCLEAGGNRDDVTICVVDVKYQ